MGGPKNEVGIGRDRERHMPTLTTFVTFPTP